MKIENQTAIIGAIFGFAIGIISMWFVDYDKSLNYAIQDYDLIEMREDIKEIEVTICEECWYDVFDCGENYQYTD